MGRRLAAVAIESQRFDIVAALEHRDSAEIGRDVGELAGTGTFGVKVSAELAGPCDVLIDFSLPEGTLQWLDACRRRGAAMVTGTTGLTQSQQAEIADAASVIPIVRAANMSVGVNVLLKIVGQVARALGEDYDVEIAETHHRFKADAPSGTAVALAKAICAATGREYGECVTLGRGGQCPRAAGEIGIHAVRLGDTVGEHEVSFGTLGETVTLRHAAHTRDTFATGALRAAEWVVGRPAGLYSMQAVLGL
jgi:4-hydroxy-tetrahydrodipicolinate reductase